MCDRQLCVEISYFLKIRNITKLKYFTKYSLKIRFNTISKVHEFLKSTETTVYGSHFPLDGIVLILHQNRTFQK